MKKFILPCLILLVCFTLVSIFSSSVFAFFHDKDKTYFAADCSSLLGDVTEDNIPVWSGAGVESVKKLITNEKDDFCELVKNRDNYAPPFQETFKLSFIKNKNNILDTLGQLKGQENKDLQINNQSILTYSGSTLNVDGPNKAREVLSIDNCIIELTADVNLPSNEVFKWDKNGVENAMGMVSGHLSFEISEITRSKNVTDFCQGKKDLLKEKLIDDSTSTGQQTKPQQSQTDEAGQQTESTEPPVKQEEENSPAEAASKDPFPFLYEIEFGSSESDNYEYEGPLISAASRKYYFGNDGYAFVEIKLSYVSADPRGEPIFKLPFEDAVFKNDANELKELFYRWGDNSGVVLGILPQSEVEFLNPTQDETSQGATRVIKLNEGGIEAKVVNDDPNNSFGIWTPLGSVNAKFTHFWVTQDPEKKQIVVGVYEGKVEVKTKGGKTTTVVPNGDKPGVVVVAKKLSVTKLAIAGVILVGVIGGAVLVLRKRIISNKLNKRRR